MDEMDEKKREDFVEEDTNENEPEREEETKDEIRDEVYVNDDEIEMLSAIEKKLTAFEEKLESAISMFVDSGAIIQDSVDNISEQEKEDYAEDFINIDEMDLSL